MERHTLLLDWKNQYHQHDHTTQGNLQIQCNPYQFTQDIFHRTQTKYFKVCLEAQRHPEKEKWSWRNQAPWLQTILQNYSHQNRMVLAQRNIEQWNRIESPELNPHTYSQLIWESHILRLPLMRTEALKGDGEPGKPVREYSVV